MIVDTGSTHSHLRSSDLSQIGFTGQSHESVLMQTTAGVVQERLYMLPSVQIVGGPPLGPAAVGTCDTCRYRVLGELVLQRLNLRIERDKASPISWSTNRRKDLSEDFRFFLEAIIEDGHATAVNYSGIHIDRATVQWCSEDFKPIEVLDLKPDEHRRLWGIDPCPVPPSGYFSSVTIAPESP
ncbi:MAG: aspartyl protease family protein [Alphaproteobacteria bacterium]|nr:aspartyl protease family protein [Alphaproteobacteria bacterium]